MHSGLKGIIHFYADLIIFYETLKFFYCVVDSDLMLSKFPCPGIYSNLGLTLLIFFALSHQSQKDPTKMQLFRLNF